MRFKKKFRKLAIVLTAVVGITSASTISPMFDVLSTKTVNVSAAYNYNYNYDDGASGITTNNIVPGNYKMKNAAAAIAIDANNGQIIYAKNINQKMKVASTAKLMTLYLVVRKAQETNGWNQVVDTSNAGLRSMSYNNNIGGGFKFIAGHKYTVRQLYQAALIQSSNNAAIALGQWVAGSNGKFIDMMNKQAKAWGISATFNSPSGLENNDLVSYGYKYSGGATAGNMVSAKALAVIAQHMLTYYPQVVNDAKKRTAKVDGQNLYNYNNLLKGRAFYDASLRVDGLKTGYTPAAGLCFVGTGQLVGKHRLITVTINDPYEFSDQRDLMRYIYKNSSVFNQ
ncbi:D-alanyl-D-alanine carboxypeptidase family protein [Lactobacillus sp. Sy-1]|uniref:D-alanyl-D-alanine carboxypeptidase family protein n=1 Tax=Lactobacillus sp. Sy-1 TaxID=2109645 RepID=UPI001C58BF60|nr:serine hydrolase [Lactobacillus sp. Sy-1]MBW1605256.1 D-alanyl-D-alanine carboxypeptidase [Lactobacillus sp. Sy-1]